MELANNGLKLKTEKMSQNKSCFKCPPLPNQVFVTVSKKLLEMPKKMLNCGANS